MARLERISVEPPAVTPRVETLNELFRAALLEVWGQDLAANLLNSPD
jgi:hypothetical protein